MRKIRVRVAREVGDRVGLWERDPHHPGGEVWVVGTGIHVVACTAAVRDALAAGRIEEVEPIPEAATAEPVAVRMPPHSTLPPPAPPPPRPRGRPPKIAPETVIPRGVKG